MQFDFIGNQRLYLALAREDATPLVEAIASPAEQHDEILAVAPVAGDPELRGSGPEVVVRLAVAAGVEADRLREIIGAMSARWASDRVVTERVDALSVQPVVLPTDGVSGLFQAALEATEEAVYNSLLKATTVTSREGSAEAIPIDRVTDVLRRYRVIP